MEELFVRVLEATAFTAYECATRWLVDAIISTGAQELSTSMSSVRPCDGWFGECTKKCAILEQSVGCGNVTECTLLHNDNQLWVSCTTMSCFEATTQEQHVSSEEIQDCYNSMGIITGERDEGFEMSVKGSDGIYIHQGDCMEMLIQHQNACSLSLSISDCTFNQSGKLVRMTVSFDEFDSGASCSSSEDDSNLEDESYESDCEEDFIIFDSDSDGCHLTSDCLETLSFNLCSSANTNNEFGGLCWEEESDFEKNLADFVRDISKPLYYETPKGIKTGNNNVPVMWSSPNVPCKGRAKKLQNDSPHLNYETSNVILNHCQRQQKSKAKTVKCVQFKQEPELVTTHSIIAWDFAYRQARIGPWERAAVDRLRFQKRIQELEEILSPVLLAHKLRSEQQRQVEMTKY